MKPVLNAQDLRQLVTKTIEKQVDTNEINRAINLQNYKDLKMFGTNGNSLRGSKQKILMAFSFDP